MLKSLEIKASIKDLKAEIDAGIKENLDMTAKAQELEAMMAEYDEALNAEQKKKTKENNSKMSISEKRASFNRALKALWNGQPVAEADKANMPIVLKAEGTGNFPTDANTSSYLIPEEFMDALVVNEGIIDLSTLVDKVPVAAPSGKIPVIDYSQKIELADFVNDNETEITKKSVAFTQDSYTLGSRGALIPVARELIQDSATDVIAVINRLFARAKIYATNKDIVAAATMEGVPTDTCDMATVATIDKIKEVLISTLPITYQNNAKILMNQKTFAKLANLKTEDGEYYIQKDVTLGQRYAIDAHEIVVCENGDMANDTIVIGDFKMIRELERAGYEVNADLSAGFKTNSVLVRALARFTVKNMWKKAFVKLTLG